MRRRDRARRSRGLRRTADRTMISNPMALEQIIPRERTATRAAERLFFRVYKRDWSATRMQKRRILGLRYARVRTCRWRCSKRVKDRPQYEQLDCFGLLG